VTETALNTLVVDVGGTHVKILATGQREHREARSGPTMTARRMVATVKRLSAGWSYRRVTIGYPGPVLHGRPLAEPHHLGKGWTGFDFRKGFGRPVKVINDAAMQALGAYEGGRMLFLGLGTGLGSAMVADGVLMPLELAHLPYRGDRTYEDYVGVRGLIRLGRRKWTSHVHAVVEILQAGLQAEYVVLGGGQTKKLKSMPRGVRVNDNRCAIRGGLRLWDSLANRKYRAG